MLVTHFITSTMKVLYSIGTRTQNAFDTTPLSSLLVDSINDTKTMLKNSASLLQHQLVKYIDQSSIDIKIGQHFLHSISDKSTIAKLGNEVDLIYILGVSLSDLHWLPLSWKSKADSVAIVDGRLFDALVPEKHGHKQAVTLMHIAAIAHAKSNNAMTVMIVEEYARVSTRVASAQCTTEWAKAALADQEKWNILRLDHFWYSYFLNKQPTCPQECLCRTSLIGLCTIRTNATAVSSFRQKNQSDWYSDYLKGSMGTCDLRSSSAYIISSQSYEPLLAQYTHEAYSVIDLALMNALPVQRIIYPMPAAQKEKMAVQEKVAEKFEEICILPKRFR